MRPSLDCAASTFEEARTFRSRSTRRLARFSVISTWVPLSLRFAVKTALRSSYEVNFRAWIASVGRFGIRVARARNMFLQRVPTRSLSSLVG